jgi:integrase/recombinase XerD
MSAFALPVEDWPRTDRELWRLAQEPAGFLEADKPASRWSPARRAIVEQAYGRWLAFLDRHGAVDPCAAPGERATEARLRVFVAELQERLAPASAGMMVGALLRMLAVLAPERDWTLLAQAHRHLKRTAVPSRDKLARMVPAAELLELGFRLMETWADGPPQRLYRATRFRNGLLIALLIACPIRLKNLAQLTIGRHLIFDGRNYRLELAAAETKTGRPYVAAIPPELMPYIDRWLREHRPVLKLSSLAGPEAGTPGDSLWLDRFGGPMGYKAVQRQIAWQTEQAFGRAIRPHLFRDCAVTELVDVAPEEIGIAADLLGHAGLQTTQKHYIHAQGMTAHARVQEMIVRRRRMAGGGS